MKQASKITFAAFAVIAMTAASARAQEITDPDIRDIRPVVMLLVDTSGSMERTPGGSAAGLPVCSGSAAGTNERDRWTTVLEALTGTWSDTQYYCTSVDRSVYSGSPDWNYYLPYNRPPLDVTQNTDGILDSYIDRMKFGLMTFDSTYTFTDSHPLLVSQTTFLGRLGDNAASTGGYSYGEPRPLEYYGCPTTFMVDSGARNAGAPSGALISVGDELTDPRTVNQQIQTQLLNVRPFGGTPTASLLFDFSHYLNTHPDVTTGDPLSMCRDRFAILLTDGQPDEDFRDARYDCDRVGGCPYPRSREVATTLCDMSTSGDCQGPVDGLFVVAFDVGDPSALAELDLIAEAGGTVAALRANDRATLMTRIGDALNAAAPGNTTRSRPAFVSSASTFSNVDDIEAQYEFNSGFVVAQRDDPRTAADESGPWYGVLERTTYTCDDSASPPRPTLDPSTRVDFAESLNNQTGYPSDMGAPCSAGYSRCLMTVNVAATDTGGNLIGTEADAVPLGATSPSSAVTGVALTPFNETIPHANFGISGTGATATARRTNIVNWVHGLTDERLDRKLGDIYHSSPVVVGPPRADIADEAYNAFRRLPHVANRPTVLYVATNDGILHAFVAEDWCRATGSSCTATSADIRAGTELWGFIPPILLPKLESATASHQIMLDGTPVIRDIFYRRLPTDPPNGNMYHTILLMGYRGGAPGYFAMDVTDPFNPIFLWQYVGEQPTGAGGGSARRVTPLGNAYGQPAMGQVLVDIGGQLQERAVALLPGGAGSVDEERARTTGPVGCPAQGIGQPPVTDGTTNARSRQRCWTNVGRVLTWVDIVTGEVIRSFDERVFNAPLTGGVSMFPGDVATDAERAFFTDADGVMWAVDFSSRNPASWDVRPFHDIFWDDEALAGQPAYNPPVITTDPEGNIVVLQSTGDIDALDSTAANRVVSLTEERSFSMSGAPTYTTSLNWEIRLHPSEQVTGPIEMFEGYAYFASFESQPDLADPCSLGQGRIWGVHYRETGSTPPGGYTDPAGAFPAPAFESMPGTGVFDSYFLREIGNRVVLGVGVTQRPTCVQGANISDPYIGSRYRVNNVSGGEFMLTAQLSGGSTGDAAGRAIETISAPLRAPQSFTTVGAFAGQVEY